MAEYFNQAITNYGEYFIRLLISVACGFIIGYERKNRNKEAGIRTHVIVTVASCLMMMVSKYGFEDLGNARFDGSRIASQIVSGIGFLGAGMIFVQKHSIKGLTTASGIWATAGVGMAIGAGMYVLGIGAAIIILVVQLLLHCNFKFLLKPEHKLLRIHNVTDKSYLNEIVELLNTTNVLVHEIKVHNDENKTDYIFDFVIEITSKSNLNMLYSKIKYDYTVLNND